MADNNTVIILNGTDLGVRNKGSGKFNECKFYLPKGKNHYYVILIKDDKEYVVPLKKSEIANERYSVCEAELAAVEREKSLYKMSILAVSEESHEMWLSSSIEIEIDFGDYNSMFMTRALSQFSARMSDIYSKVEKLTKLNIEIHDEIKKGQGVE